MLNLFKGRSKIRPPGTPSEKKNSGNTDSVTEISSLSGELGVQRSFTSESRLPRPQSRQRVDIQVEGDGVVGTMSRQQSGSDMSTDVVQHKDNNQKHDKCTPRRLLRGGFGNPSQDTNNVQVIVRIRPMSKAEIDQGIGDCCSIDPMDSSSITVRTLPENHSYTFDRVAGQDVSQSRLFEMLGRPIVENVLSGYNSCIFAYGQTGSGKTYTMLGEESTEGCLNDSMERGLIPRLFELLFERMEEEQARKGADQLKYCVKCSFLEIYNEQIADLLDPSSQHLLIREDLNLGVHVEGLTQHNVFNVADAVALLQYGAENRRSGETNMNKKSSRSHAVFTCVLESKYVVEDGLQHIYSSRLNLVDLAGSERQEKSGAIGERLKEASHINKSLTILGYVINCLVELQHGRRGHVPYRDSRLTFLLQDSLGGNSKTIMIANVSPAMTNVQETLSTVRFASRAKKIKNKAVVNEDTLGDVRLLQQEIVRLNRELHLYKSGNYKQIQQQQQQFQNGSPVTPSTQVHRSPFQPQAPPETHEIQIMTSPGIDNRQQLLDQQNQELENQKQLVSDAVFLKQMSERQNQELTQENQRLQQLYILNRRYYRRYLEFKDIALRGWKDGLFGSQENNADQMVTDESENTGEVAQLRGDKALEELFQVRQALLDLGDDPDSDNDNLLRRASQQGVMKVEDYELLQNRLQEELADNQRAYQRIEKLISDNHQLQQSQLSLDREISEFRHERMQLQQQQHSLQRARKACKIRHSTGLNDSPFSPSNSPLDIHAFAEQQNEIVAKLDSFKAEIQSKDQQLSQFQAENKKLQERVQELEADGDLWVSYVDDLKQEIQQLKGSTTTAQMKLQDYELTTQQLHDAQEQVQVLQQEKQDMSLKEGERQWFEEKLAQSQDQCQVLDARKKELLSQLAVQNQVVDEQQHLIQTLKQQCGEFADLQELFLGKKDQCSILQHELEQARVQLGQVEFLKQKQEENENLGQLCQEYREEIQKHLNQNNCTSQKIHQLEIQLENANQQVQILSGQLDLAVVDKRQLEHQLQACSAGEEHQQMCQQIQQLQQQLQQNQCSNEEGRQEMETQLRQLEQQLSNERGSHRCEMEEITQKVALAKQEAQNRIRDLQQQLKECSEQCSYYQVLYQEVQEQMQEEVQAKEQQLMSLGADLRESQKVVQDLQEEFKQIANLRVKYERLLTERERFLVKIQDLQMGADKALARADTEERKVKVLSDETNTLKQQLDVQSKQMAELQNDLSILSGQQNASQRIQHLRKVKDENNLIKVQMQQMSEVNDKLQHKVNRLTEELKHNRSIRDVDSMDLDEEFSLRDEKLRAETDKLKVTREYQQFIQTLIDMFASYENNGSDENTPPNVPELSPQKINIDSMDLNDIKQVATQSLGIMENKFQSQQQKLWLMEEQIKFLQLKQNSQS